MEISSAPSVTPRHARAGTGTLALARQRTVRVAAWTDPAGTVDPRSLYVELFWLPTVGPSTTWLIRRLADQLDTEPDGYDLSLDEMARGLGLGWSDSRHAPLRRAIERCIRYGLARRGDDGVLSVRRRLPAVPRRYLLRLPVALQEQHRAWECAEPGAGEGVRLRRRARLVALDLRELGVDDACIERHLLRRGVHPATAFEAARWAWSPESASDRPVGAGGG